MPRVLLRYLFNRRTWIAGYLERTDSTLQRCGNRRHCGSMNGETISRAQLLLQYYSALAELEEEGRLTASDAVLSIRTAQGTAQIDAIPQPIVLQNELRASA